MGPRTSHVSTAVVLALALVLSATVAACGWLDGGGAGADGPGDGTRKVTVAGDSISVGLGAAFRETMRDDVEVKVIGIGGSGLARPDKVDWPARLEELARDFPPTVLVLSLSSNDAQDLRDPDGDVVAAFGDDAAWEAEYRARLARSFDAFAESGTTVVWVGHVRIPDERVGGTNRRLHRIAAEVAAARPWVQVEDLAELTGSGGDDDVSTCLLADDLHLRPECYLEATTRLGDRLPLT